MRRPTALGLRGNGLAHRHEAGGNAFLEMGADQERLYLPHRNQERQSSANPINDRVAEVFREVRRGNQLKSAYVLLNNLPSGKQMVNIGLEVKKGRQPLDCQPFVILPYSWWR